MARGGWSRQPRDRRGRWTSVGSGAAMQTGGRGARLMSPGKQRDGGGKRQNLVGANDQAMTSLPRNTIGKSARTRGMQRVDMMGSGKGAKFDAAKQAQKDAIKARKAGPQEMSEAAFAAKVGGKTKYDHMSFAAENARAVGGRGKAAQRRYEQQEAKLSADIAKTKADYNAAIKSGKIKAPSNSLARKAQGQADNPAVQAAKRLQAKTAAKRAQRASKPQSVDALNSARKQANANEQRLREAYFKTSFGTPAQASARKALLAAEKKSQKATNAWRDAKAARK